ncbi:Transcriptional regulator GlxA family, contains an amidase domain and an AraC-type DNA-binding HTH domain [Palleronia marisminoris]|uniref:HTH-type transcriptional regulator CdhR n=1 Tax=Palleronia marisminoris TaxID=315423 RepID=A0A1Y5SFK8_9RHOB|nr:GlxA family transcriptional regulator [Palleronia marisminoris]SFG79068.1 Transcriptional regulator GlxA family, contains an amidase domain and an AraC-type DNA-binding HTH domain [Palleronia marisminoris]SLN38900.1 HTH-type transcriptional regulator CdhR [Palleronia marisminoris]
MTLVDPPAEIAILHYPGAQLSALYGLTDVFGIASEQSQLIGGATAPMLRVTHWRPEAAAGPIAKTFDTHPGLVGRPVVAIAAPSLRDLPNDPVLLDTLAAWLKDRHASGCVICSVCSGAFLLARAGLLDGRSATLHWCHAVEFAERYPAVRIDADSLLVDDGDIITAGAVMAWTDLGLRIVHRQLGSAVTVATARYMLFDPAGREQRHYSGFAPRLNHGDRPVLGVQHWLQATGARDVTVAAMAERAMLERRTFLRRFFKATGLKPKEYCQQLRMGRAREMLELSSRTVAQIAWEVGYSDEAAFRKVFRKIVGLPPGIYRLRFRPEGTATALPPKARTAEHSCDPVHS